MTTHLAMRLRLHPHLHRESLTHDLLHTPHHEANQMPSLASISNYPRRDGPSRPLSRLPNWLTQNNKTSSTCPAPAIPQDCQPRQCDLDPGKLNVRGSSVSSPFVAVNGPMQGWTLLQALVVPFLLTPSLLHTKPAVMSMSLLFASPSQIITLPLALPLPLSLRSSPSSPGLLKVRSLHSLGLLLLLDHSLFPQSWSPIIIVVPSR